MAEKTYTVRTSRFGYMLNRAKVEEAALEGRIVPPVVEYAEQGEEVKLDPGHTLTKRALQSGSIEEPGASQQRRAEELQAELDRIQAEQDRLQAERSSLEGSAGDDGPTLAELRQQAEDRGLAKSGSKAELSERIAAHDAGE